MIIYKAYVSLSHDKGWKYRFEEIQVEETPKTFIGQGKRISKDKILLPDTLLLKGFNFYHYFTYCFAEQRQQALDLLKAKILKEVEANKVKFDKVYAHAVTKSPNALGDILHFAKMLIDNGIKADISHDVLKMKNYIKVFNFYKSDTVEIYEEEGSFIAHSRYDIKTPINSIEDLVQLNYQWWQSSKAKLEDWETPSPEWETLYKKLQIAK